MNKLIILRGVSGSGKSTIAEHIINRDEVFYNEWASFEADQFFEGVGVVDKYKFDANLLPIAHQLCKNMTEMMMFHETPLVVVSNTSTRIWEMKYYLELAEKYDYEIEIIKSPGPWDAEVLFQRNKHGVPLDVIQKQINRYEPHPDESEWTDMSVFE